MTTPLDRDLAERLERLAAAVPVHAGRLDPVHANAVVARQRVRMSWLTPLVALVVLVLIAGLVGIGSLNVLNGPISATTKLGDFTLTITSAKARYRTGEVVVIDASLTYTGAADHIEIAHALGGPLGFGIKEPVRGFQLSPGWRLSCNQRQLNRGIADEKAFTKSGGYDGPDQVGFARFMQEPTLALSAGTWHPYVMAEFSLGDCRGEARERISMRAELTIDVEDQPGPSLASPTPIPESGAIHIVNLDPRTVEIVFRNRLVALLACGESAVIAAAKLESSSPWHFIVRTVEDETIDAATLDWRLPAGILIRDGTVLSGPWPMSYGPPATCDRATEPSPSSEPTTATPDGSQLDLATVDEPATGAIDLCPMALAQATLVRNPRTGLGFTSGLGDVRDVVWPAGYTAWIEGGLAVLRDASGELVAREGDIVRSGGGFTTDGRWYACSVRVGFRPDTP